MRAAIYARYSSENQSERSIEDQVRLCRELVTARGGEVVEVFADYAISGSSLKNRPAAAQLLEGARAGRFDTVVAEALDRISRDQEDVAGIFKRLRFAGVAIVTVAEGAVDELHVGLKGTMNALFIRDLAQKVRRGQRGRIEQGRSAGGLSYGYDVVRELGPDGELDRGRRAINEQQAAVVRGIFDAFLAGESPRAIAARLNREREPAPSGRQWNASTINGCRGRGNGILFNRLYIGELVYNRLRMEKDPETGKRVSRLNPQSQWIVKPAPELVIVAREAWDAVQAHKSAHRRAVWSRQHRPRHLFSGLLRCACCGGPYVVKGMGYLACSRHDQSGTCENGRTVRRAELERRVLEGLKAKLLAPAVLREALREYHEERTRLRRREQHRERAIAKQLPALSREIERLVDRICAGTDTPASNARLVALERDKAELSAELAELERAASPVALHPGAIEAYTRAVEDLAATLAGGAGQASEAAALVRRLVDHIDVTPGTERGDFQLTAYGRLAELTAIAAGNKTGTIAVPAVAGERYSRDRNRDMLAIAC